MLHRIYFWRKHILTALVLLIVGVEAGACLLTLQARTSPMPQNFGNTGAVVRQLPARNSDQFTFAVVGDTRSFGTFRHMAGDIAAEQPDFTVILGDWVNDGTPDQHAWFRRNTADYGLTGPVFFTPGNHDIDPATYPLGNFDHAYGPANFSFVHNNSLFLFISNLDGRFANTQGVAFLQQFTPEALRQYDHRFLFMHIPPAISPDIKERHTRHEDELLRLIDHLHMDYVIAADFHGLNRTRRNGTEFLISGGGGAHLDTANGPQFYHALLLTVGNGFVSERILPEQSHFDLRDWLGYNLAVKIGPFLLNHWLLCLLLPLLLPTWFLWRRNGRAQRSAASGSAPLLKASATALRSPVCTPSGVLPDVKGPLT